MIDSDNAQHWQLAAPGWVSFMDEGDANRTHLLDPWVLQACGDVSGLLVLDDGCGEGRFGRMLAAQGATVVGMDVSRDLASEAKTRGDHGRFAVAKAESLPFPDETFDLVASYVVLVHVEDFVSALREMCRVVKPAGRVVLANMSAIATCVAGFRQSSSGEKQFCLHPYSQERSGWIESHGARVLQYHRPLDCIFRVFLDAGMELVDYREPVPTPETIRLRPALADATRFPYFFVTEWWKPD